ncbi:MAG: hypothetical protein HC915_01390, partial [Anaerolineae bacterium]|nr:hypothetical protein [Anaerolineae bacterium]
SLPPQPYAPDPPPPQPAPQAYAMESYAPPSEMATLRGDEDDPVGEVLPPAPGSPEGHPPAAGTEKAGSDGEQHAEDAGPERPRGES